MFILHDRKTMQDFFDKFMRCCQQTANERKHQIRMLDGDERVILLRKHKRDDMAVIQVCQSMGKRSANKDAYNNLRILGYITVAGAWWPMVAGCDEYNYRMIDALLFDFTSNPSGTVMSYAEKHKRCCVCGGALKDKRLWHVNCADIFHLREPWSQYELEL